MNKSLLSNWWQFKFLSFFRYQEAFTFITLQLAVELLFLLLQTANPLLKGFHLQTPILEILPGASIRQRHLTHAAAVWETAICGVGEAHEGQVLPGETRVRYWGSDVLQGETERIKGSIQISGHYSILKLSGLLFHMGQNVFFPHQKSSTNRVFQHIIVYIKVGGVWGRADVRDVRCLCVANVLPVDAGEEGVLLELLDAVLTQPTLSTADQPLDQVFSILGHIRDVRGELETLLNSAN